MDVIEVTFRGWSAGTAPLYHVRPSEVAKTLSSCVEGRADRPRQLVFLPLRVTKRTKTTTHLTYKASGLVHETKPVSLLFGPSCKVPKCGPCSCSEQGPIRQARATWRSGIRTPVCTQRAKHGPNSGLARSLPGSPNRPTSAARARPRTTQVRSHLVERPPIDRGRARPLLPTP